MQDTAAPRPPQLDRPGQPPRRRPIFAPHRPDGNHHLPGEARYPGIEDALSAFIALLSIGVVRRWRWVFWLILVAFVFGVLRVPVAVLQLTGVLPTNVPTWYVLLQGLIGLAQLAIAAAMLAGYRRSGVWGAF